MSPIPPLKRRSYGYIEDGEQHQHQKPKITRIASRERQPQRLWRIFLFPLIILGRIAAFLWRWRPRLPKAAKHALWRYIVKFFLATGIAGLLVLVVLVIWASRDLPDPDRLTDRHVAQSTKIYDRTGKHILREIYTNEKRTLVNLDDIPKHVIHGVIATEDKLFYEHRGVRPLSILRAFAYAAIGKSSRVGGTSTITQQLVKNAILTDERTLVRKFKELVLSVRLEQVYTKNQILKIYFNEIPYGSTNYGIEAASQSYFGKPVSELDLQESATLAGLPKAPSRYLNNPEALKNRRDFVLERMFEEGYITRAEADAAQASPIMLSQKIRNIETPHFVFYVKGLLSDEFGEKMVDTGGLRVITTLDYAKQQTAEAAVSSSQKILLEAKADNAALIAIDPKNGHILAMVGSRDYNDASIDGNFNAATQGYGRQPGSSFKPVIYAAAFSKGYTPDTLLFDVSTNFAVPGAKEYHPGNYDGKEHGLVTMRQALQNSYNIPAVQTLYLVGLKDALTLARKLGYTTLDEKNVGLSLVLGGAEVHLLEHVNAYATFANNGTHHPTVAILRVEDARGNVLKEWRPESGEAVLDPSVTATVSDVLSDDATRAPTFGASGILTLPDRPVAAKTGTTNDYKDGWTIGYTPSLAAGVWVGRSDAAPLKPGYGGSKVAGVIWNEFMKNALKGTPAETFPPPPPNTAAKPILRGAVGGNITMAVNRVTGRIATSSTPSEDIVEKTFIPAHSILHYVNKDDPDGAPPENPESDPQYEIWEAAIRDWIVRTRKANPDWDVAFEDPPTAYDDPESFVLTPALTILSPEPQSTISSRRITANIQASAPRGVAKVTYRIDGQLLDVLTAPSFHLDAYVPTLADGPHTLTIVVEDDIGNKRMADTPFVLSAGIEPPGVSWMERSASVLTSQFPRTFFLNHYRLGDIREVRVYAEQSGSRNLLSSITNLNNLYNNQLMVSWTDGQPGTWSLVAEVVLVDGTAQEADTMTVYVQ